MELEIGYEFKIEWSHLGMISIEELKTKISRIAVFHGVAEVYLFGSYARGEATSESDLDLVIRPGRIKTYMQLSRFFTDLEKRTFL